MMNDKNIQRQTESDLVNFCAQQGYERSGSITFPLTSTEFKMVFAFLVRHLDREYQLVNPRNFPEEVCKTLREIGYPAHVSKQTFQTLGTQHSWPSVLAVLHYVMGRAKVIASVEDHSNLHKIIFPNRDEDGFEENSEESEELIMHECFIDCYASFNDGNDDYNRQLTELERRFYLREGINLAKLKKQTKEMGTARKTLDDMTAEFNRKDLQDQNDQNTLKAKQTDLEKMKDFVSKLETRNDTKIKDIEILKHSIVASEEKEQILKTSLGELRETCMNDKNIDPDNVSPHIEYAIHALERQVEDAKSLIKRNDEFIWQGEMEYSKMLNDIEEICRHFNDTLIHLGIYSKFQPYGSILHDQSDVENPFKLHQTVELNEAREFLRSMDRNLTSNEKLTVEHFLTIEKDLQITIKELEMKSIELKQMKTEMEVKSNDKEAIRNRIHEEEISYMERLSALKNNVMTEKSKEGKNLSRLEAKLKNLEEEGAGLFQQIKGQREEAHKLLTEAPKSMLAKKQEQVAYLNKQINEYKKEVEEKLSLVEKENAEIQKYVAQLPKVKK